MFAALCSAAFLPSVFHELFLLCNAPLPCHPASEQANCELKLLQTGSYNKPVLLYLWMSSISSQQWQKYQRHLVEQAENYWTSRNYGMLKFGCKKHQISMSSRISNSKSILFQEMATVMFMLTPDADNDSSQC